MTLEWPKNVMEEMTEVLLSLLYYLSQKDRFPFIAHMFWTKAHLIGEGSVLIQNRAIVISGSSSGVQDHPSENTKGFVLIVSEESGREICALYCSCSLSTPLSLSPTRPMSSL